ncbi:MAG: ABC transporter permease [Spirochaetaceae bacterium]|nr:MAG: ABC transporter permease [Spirochaetaceae bacterium]
MKLGRIAFRNIRRNKRRSLLSGTAILIATMFITFMFSLIAGMLDDVESNIVRYVSGHIRIRNLEYDENEQLNPLHLSVVDYEDVVQRLEVEPEVAAVVPRTRFFTAIYRNDRTYGGIGLGVDFQREASVMRIQEALERGRLPEKGEKEMALSAGLAEELDLDVGEKLTLLTKNKYMGMSGMTFTVTGIVRFLVTGFNESFFLVPIDTTARFLKMDNEATEVLVVLRDRRQVDAFTEKVTGILSDMGRDNVSTQPWNRIGATAGWMEYARTAYDVIALVFFLLASTVIINTTMMVIFERMREIGTVAAMGMTPREIVHLFFLEAFYIGAIAAFIGVLLGIGITLPLSKVGIDLTQSMEGVGFEVNPVVYPRLNIRSTVFVFFYSTAIASLASFIPSRRAAKIEPVEALRAV